MHTKTRHRTILYIGTYTRGRVIIHVKDADVYQWAEGRVILVLPASPFFLRFATSENRDIIVLYTYTFYKTVDKSKKKYRGEIRY